MSYVYELYPIEGDIESPVFLLREGQNRLQVNEKMSINIEMQLFPDGSVILNSEKKMHNELVKLYFDGGVFERLFSILKRGELNVMESTRLALHDWENQVCSVWPPCIELPRIGFSHKQNEMNLLKIRWNKNGSARVGHILEIKLLSGEASSLLWCPFPDMDEIPDMQELSSLCMGRPFHTVKPMAPNATLATLPKLKTAATVGTAATTSPIRGGIHGGGRAELRRVDFEVPLSLRTACFEHEYPFSGTTHPKEEKTPPSLMNLCTLVEDIFSHGQGNGPNMILVNYYPTGSHKISRHQDNDKAMGVLRDVYAFVDGYAREMEFAKEWNQKNKSGTARNEEGDSECVLKINIPRGFYCMYGQRFQQLFTHEIKETHAKELDTLFTSMKRDPEFTDMPLNDIHNRVKIPRAEYIMKHKDTVRKFILKTPTQMSIQNMFGNTTRATTRAKTERADENTVVKRRRTECTTWFDEWIQPRISYTLRRFE